MRFAALLLAAAAFIGSVVAAPLKDTDVAISVRSVDKAADSPIAERQAPAALGSAVPGAAVQELAAEIKASIARPYTNRGHWVQNLLNGVGEHYKGYNVFVYHRFQGHFQWSVADPAHAIVGEAQYRDAVGTAHFRVIVFKSAGRIEHVAGPGGWPNWGFTGNYWREGNDLTLFEAQA